MDLQTSWIVQEWKNGHGQLVAYALLAVISQHLRVDRLSTTITILVPLVHSALAEGVWSDCRGRGSSLFLTPASRPLCRLSVHCASPGRGGELVGVCGVCARCVGWGKSQAACRVFLSAPSLGMDYCLAKP